MMEAEGTELKLAAAAAWPWHESDSLQNKSRCLPENAPRTFI